MTEHKEIASEQWTTFCEEFSRQHHGWWADIEVSVPGQEPRRATDELLFQGIAEEQCAGGVELVLSLADSARLMLTRVSQPVKLEAELSADGSHEGLRIQSRDGRITWLRFRSPAHPEELDGIAPSEH